MRNQHRYLRLHDASGAGRRRAGTSAMRRCRSSAPAVRRAPSSMGSSRRASARSASSTARAHAPRRWRGSSVRASRCMTGESARGDRARLRVLVNTTTIGLEWRRLARHRLSGFDADCVVADIVYVPLETELLARAQGARPAHRRRPRHAAAPGGAGLREVVRRAPRGDGCAATDPRRRHRGASHADRRAHRLARHGQVDGGRLPARARHPRVRRRCRGAPAL